MDTKTTPTSPPLNSLSTATSPPSLRASIQFQLPPSNRASLVPFAIAASQVLGVTSRKLSIPLVEQSAVPDVRFSSARSEVVNTAVLLQDFLLVAAEFQNSSGDAGAVVAFGAPEVDLTKLKDISFMQKVIERSVLLRKVSSFSCVKCTDFEQHVRDNFDIVFCTDFNFISITQMTLILFAAVTLILFQLLK